VIGLQARRPRRRERLVAIKCRPRRGFPEGHGYNDAAPTALGKTDFAPGRPPPIYPKNWVSRRKVRVCYSLGLPYVYAGFKYGLLLPIMRRGAPYRPSQVKIGCDSHNGDVAWSVLPGFSRARIAVGLGLLSAQSRFWRRQRMRTHRRQTPIYPSESQIGPALRGGQLDLGGRNP